MAYPPKDKTWEGTMKALDKRLVRQERRQNRDNGWVGQGNMTMGFLPATYRGWGKTPVVIDGVLSTEAYGWAVPYDPQGPRLVRLVFDGTTWVIVGQSVDETIMLPYDDTKVDIYAERAGDTVWNLRPRATLLALSGLVVLSGMMMTIGTQPAGTVIATLPVGMRPPYTLMFGIEYGDAARTLGINANGQVILISAPPSANAYVSLDGIAFHAAGYGTWTNVGDGGSSFGANFGNWPDANYSPCQFYKDPWGFVWNRGLARVNVATAGDNTPIVNLPATHRTNLEAHFRSTGQDTYAGLGASVAGGVTWKAGSPGVVGNWISLTGAVIATTDSLTLNPWKTIKVFSNGWVAYAPGTFPAPAYVRRADGLVMLKGLTGSGTINTKQTSLTQEEMWPAGGRIIIAAIANQARARLDIFSARDTEAGTGGPGTMTARSASNAWFAWDGLKWLP